MINVLIIDSGIRNDHPLFSALSISGFAYEKGEVINDFYDSFGHGAAIFNIIQKGCQTLDVINLSLGINICERYEDFYEVCKKHSEKGVVIVSAFDKT